MLELRAHILTVTDFQAGLDVSIRALHDFCGWSPTIDRIAVSLEALKASLFVGIVGCCGLGLTRCRGGARRLSTHRLRTLTTPALFYVM
jgi:hypothetical protein